VPLAFNSFLMIFGRLTGLFISAPIFSSRQMPGRIKVLIIAVLSIVMASFVPVKYAVSLSTPAYFIAAWILEVFIGYSIGFVAYVLFASIQLAGQLMDMQMGFGVVNVLDPQSGTQVPLMGNFNYLLALLMYLFVNGHHYLLSALNQSYQVIPVLGTNLGSDFISLLVQLSAYMFVIAVKISAPMLIAIMITNVAMGFIARTVPQMNVFMVGMPLNIMVGFMILFLLLPVYLWFMGELFGTMVAYLDAVLIAMGK